MRSLRSQLSLWLRRLANWLTPRTQAAPPDDPLLDDLIEHVAYEMAAMAAAAVGCHGRLGCHSQVRGRRTRLWVHDGLNRSTGSPHRQGRGFETHPLTEKMDQVIGRLIAAVSDNDGEPGRLLTHRAMSFSVQS